MIYYVFYCSFKGAVVLAIKRGVWCGVVWCGVVSMAALNYENTDF
jgi:hypothetical protein